MEFTTADGFEAAECECDSEIKVLAECESVPGCDASLLTTVVCEEPQCPSISWSGIEISECKPDGTRTVTISAQLDSPSLYSAELRDSTATVLDSVSGSGILTLSGSGDYAGPGPEIFDVVITSPEGCPGMSLPLGIPTCPKCPRVNFDYEIGGCDESGNRTVTITAELNSPDPYTAELRNASDTVLDTVSGSGIQTLSHSEAITGGTSKTFKVVITSPTTCGNTEVEIDVPPCDCPEIDFDSAFGECDDSGQRSVTVTATLNSSGTYTAELRDPSDTVVDSVTGSGSQTLSHTASFFGGSTQTFRVVITDPALCGDSEFNVTVLGCNGTPPDDDESSGCGGLRLAVAIAGALAILATLLAICVPPAATALFIIAGVFAAVALITGILYAIFCPNKPCKVGLLISGQSSLGGGVAAIILSACCPWMIWAGLILTVIGLSTLLLWRSQCEKSTCALAKEITKVIGGVVLPIIGIIAVIPILTACISGMALAGVGAVFGPIAAYAASC